MSVQGDEIGKATPEYTALFLSSQYHNDVSQNVIDINTDVKTVTEAFHYTEETVQSSVLRRSTYLLSRLMRKKEATDASEKKIEALMDEIFDSYLRCPSPSDLALEEQICPPIARMESPTLAFKEPEDRKQFRRSISFRLRSPSKRNRDKSKDSDLIDDSTLTSFKSLLWWKQDSSSSTYDTLHSKFKAFSPIKRNSGDMLKAPALSSFNKSHGGNVLVRLNNNILDEVTNSPRYSEGIIKARKTLDLESNTIAYIENRPEPEYTKSDRGLKHTLTFFRKENKLQK
ncbi:uncharacterized protein RJT20DRAFT_3262 [Scheffersomyces xylosifermentans]|uniref:uncharacterized protein n=1 Tax=Scheffersomyces xylosifermentans TaxID=1304137 RepID=UPI00315D61F9